MLEDLKNLFSGGDKQSNLMRNILILGVIGILLLFFSNTFLPNGSSPSTEQKTSTRTEKVPPAEDYAGSVARDLEEIISLIKGVGEVRVKVYTRMSPVYEHEINRHITDKVTSETDQNGGRRTVEEDDTEEELVVIRDAGGSEQPVLKRKILPEITGVMIVAQGAEVSSIKYEIVKSVSSLLDLAEYRISVSPYKRR